MNRPSNQAVLPRRAAALEILKHRGEGLIVAGLGAPCWDTNAAGDNPLNFYVWGGMGGTAMIGLGLALAQPQRRVLVLTGDGDMLMGLGSFATIAVQRPQNLAIVVMDNEHYGETGMQETHTRFGVDLAGMALAAGFVAAATVRTDADLRHWSERVFRDDGPLFVSLKVSTERGDMVLPPRDGPTLVHRTRAALLGDKAPY